MSKRLPPLNALRVFDAAARHLSFTRAADELFVTQAAVSHQIKSLEDFLGLKLFRRRNRSLLLTEEGQSYFQDIKEIFSQLTEATRKLQARSAKGALTVSLLPSFAIQWLVPRLSSFNSAYPGIDVRIQAVDRQEDKLADDVDVAIFYGRGNWPGLRVEKLYAEYLLPVCSPMLLTGEKALKTAVIWQSIRFYTMLPAATGKLIPASWVLTILTCSRDPSLATVRWCYRLPFTDRAWRWRITSWRSPKLRQAVWSARLMMYWSARMRFIWFVMTVRQNWVK